MCREVTKKFMALLLSVCMIAGMVDWSGLTVVHAADEERLNRVEEKDKSTFVYDGTEKIITKDNIIVKNLSGQEVPASDYEIQDIANNVNAGNGTFKIVGKNTYEDQEISGTFTINPKDIGAADSNITVTGETQYVTSAGTYNTTTVTVQDGNKTLADGGRDNGSTPASGDYVYSIADTEITDNDGVGTITVRGIHNYAGTKTGTYNIVRRKDSEFTIEWKNGADSNGVKTKFYDGNKVEFTKDDVVVKYNGGSPLNDSDYELQYGDYSGAVINGEVKARGISKEYAGLTTEQPAKFRILKQIGGAEVNRYPANKRWTATVKDQPRRYTGKDISLAPDDIEVNDPDGGAVSNDEWEIKEILNSNKVGTATVVIQAKDSVDGKPARYGGEYTAEFEVKASQLTADIVHIDDSEFIYDGKTNFYNEIEKHLEVSEGEDPNKIVYNKDADYTLEKLDGEAVHAGTYRIRIARTNNSVLQGGAVTVSFTVKPRPLTASGFTFTFNALNGDNYYKSDGEYYLYTGSSMQPKLNIAYNGVSLEETKDYTLSYSNNMNAGTATVTVTAVEGSGKDYSGKIPKDFTIKPVKIEKEKHYKLLTETKTYNASPQDADFSLSVNNIPLRKGTDYIINYPSGNTNAGEVPFTITGQGNYEGEINDKFTIRQLAIEDLTLNVSGNTRLEYTSREVYPQLTVGHRRYGKMTEGTDYTISFKEKSIDVKEGYEYTITGIGNYTGDVTRKYDIVPCNISTQTPGDGLNSGIDIYSQGGTPNGETYNFLNGQPSTKRVYAYTSKKVEPPVAVRIANHNAMTENTHYTVTYDGENTKLGEGTALVEGIGNYTGSRRITFTIKGDLASGFVNIVPEEQVYSATKITPKGTTVTFNGDPLTEGKDFVVANEIEEPVTTVGGGHDAIIRATEEGNVLGEAHFQFSVRKFNLSEDIGKDPDNQFDIQMEQSHIYSGLSIKPKPVITHNGQNVTETQDYTLTYYKVVGDVETGKRGELIENPTDVGTYEVEITGTGANYEGTTSKRYTISPYDIGTGYTNKEILVEGVDGDVVLDTLKEASAQEGYAGNAQYNPTDGMVTWKDLALKHRLKDNDDEALQTKKPMVLATKETKGDYIATYTKNNTIGRAEIKIQAVNGGNYTGEFTVYFKIKGDLTKAEIEVKDWTYTPPKEADGPETNCPIPTLVYKVEYGEEKTEIPLEEGTDYTLEWENNDKATKSDEDTLLDENLAPENIPFVKVIPTTAPEGDNGESKLGYYVNETGANFHIIQRDLGRTIESEGVEKDTELELGNFNLEKPEYEYTGSAIVPDINITCAGGQVVKKAGDDDTNYDYEVTAINNTDAFEWEGEVGVGEPLKPLMTVAAKQVDGKYTGNYKGSFTCNFTVTPRQISKETIDTTIPIVGVPEEVDYTGEDITFPIDDANPVVIMWYKEGLTEAVELRENQDYVFDYDAGNNTKIGKGELVIKGKEWSNYAGEYIKEFKIMASIEEVDKNDPVYMTLEYDENVPYGVTAVYPDLKFVDKSGYLCGDTEEPYHELVLGEDFEIIPEGGSPSENGKGTSRNNINVGTYDKENPDEEHNQDAPTIVVRGKNYYRGEIRRYYNITPKDLKDESITVRYPEALTLEGYENAFVYTGNEITPRIEVYNGTNLMETPRDYTITGYDNNTNLSTETNKAKITIAATEGGNYIGEQTFEFDIVPQPIEEMQVTIANENAIYYDRKAKQPEISVFYRDGGRRIDLTEGTDYTVDYGNYIDAARGNDEDESKRPTIILKGINGYGGEKKVHYTILPENIANEEDIEVTGRLLYTGGEGPFKPVFTVTAKDGTVLREITEEGGEGDYTVAEYTGTPVIGSNARTTITGYGNYTGTRQVEFRVIPPKGTFQIEDIPDEAYNSMPHRPAVKVSLLVEDQARESLSIDLVEGTDYEVSYSDNVNAGTATVTVQGVGDFKDQQSVTKNFNITKRGIGTGLALMDYMTLASIPDQQYTGRGITPQMSLTYKDVYQNDAGEQENIEKTLIQGNDYVVSYTNNIAVGTATANITGINNYSGSYQTTFRIYGNMNMAMVAEIPTQDYTGSPVTPVPDVNFGGKKLTEGTDYTLEYKDNTERGTATIIITGIGQYTGTKTVTFTIARELEDSATIKGVASAYTYTGAAITPPVRVEDNGTVLTKGKDYQISYKDNINAGTASITITGLDKYQGSKTITFQITPQQLGRATVAKISDKTYTGKELKPAIKVTSGNVTLKNGTDYTLVYVGGEKPGRASVIIKGTGNYTGTQTVNYNIAVPKMSGVKVSKYANNSLTFSWKKNNVVSGYEIYNSKNRREKKITKKTTLKGTVSKLTAGKAYTFRIRAYVTKGGKYYYGPFTTIKTATAPNSTKISKVTSTKKNQAVVKWSKVSGATKYEVYRSTSKKGKYTKVGTSKKTSYTDKKATGGKTYYYKVRVCKTISKKNYYSSYSPVKSVKAKK